MGQILSYIWGEAKKPESHTYPSGGYSFNDLRRKKEIVWCKHYNNEQRILLVGEGDFSFSACLAVVFGSSSSNITATSLNSIEFLHRNYRNAIANIQKLTSRGATVMHRVDATTMSSHSFLRLIKYDRIIYNFPFYGFRRRNETRESNLQKHRELVRGFLWNAKKMLQEDGEIHISHKTNGFHLEWNVKELASLEGLCLLRQVKFNLNDYPGYETKYGFGGDKNFDCNPSMTYIWRIASTGPH
ncbi:uncharacterized protein At4g26485-like [Impatiens glandulifera]|uniref:uncharacterized protein At4g26485-like n=1 Tax=Impatiens glandulifera TaxID=253017 RepID=UPI001FB145B0|nr:uncharacterized protein At4g26485-like [Impatiens glandulifera]